MLCVDDNTCTDDTCDPQEGCLHEYNEAPCEDGDPCTAFDGCHEGKCVPGETTDCDDDNPCTDEDCQPFVGCVFVDNAKMCDDGDKCTIEDTCRDGTCYGGDPVSCDDGNPCTDDVCDPGTGCLHDFNAAPCDDADPCWGPDICQDGQCLAQGMNDCDDGNDCTADSCEPSNGCLHDALHGVQCDDGNGCTTGDICDHGVCVGEGMACNDGNPCTDDVCDPGTGCSHLFNLKPCDDGNICTAGDSCQQGNCVGGAAADCNDHNACTTDSCDPTEGCIHVPNELPCEDGNKCTLGDQCVDGVCIPGQPPDCKDHNPCTNDLCTPASGCIHVDNEAPCNDGDLCTTNDRCQGGTCVGGLFLDCEDGNACTTDTCDPAWGCVHEDNEAPCEDGLFCTVDDSCSQGQCLGGPVMACDDGDACTDDTCDETLGCVHAIPNETCDGLDNDCDGETDEELGVTTCGEGECTVVVKNCIDGVPQECVPGEPGEETCDGLDNDCDGQSDEAIGVTTCGKGECLVTIQTCVDGMVQECIPGEPGEELCDGLDNDCDGETDEETSEDCTTYYNDTDGDGYGVEDDHMCMCAPGGDIHRA